MPRNVMNAEHYAWYFMQPNNTKNYKLKIAWKVGYWTYLQHIEDQYGFRRAVGKRHTVGFQRVVGEDTWRKKGKCA